MKRRITEYHQGWQITLGLAAFPVTEILSIVAIGDGWERTVTDARVQLHNGVVQIPRYIGDRTPTEIAVTYIADGPRGVSTGAQALRECRLLPTVV